MSHVFLSHASEDKRKLRSLVEALSDQGIQFWIDRPGYGDSHFNFEYNFIQNTNILAIPSGQDWDHAITGALRDSQAVLFCLSRAFMPERHVLLAEVSFAYVQQKVVGVIIDDLSYDDLPKNLGVLDFSKIHFERIDLRVLRTAIRWRKAHPDTDQRLMPPRLKANWEILLKIKRDLTKILVKDGTWRPSAKDMDSALVSVQQIPIGPYVRPYQVPTEIIRMFANSVDRPNEIRNHISLAMQLRSQCNAEQYTDDQILVRMSELPPPESTTSIDFWTAALTLSGQKSRRTLASVLKTPSKLFILDEGTKGHQTLSSFLSWLSGT